MCGIAGILAFDGQVVDPSVLQEMGDRLAHRGPDGEGFVVATRDLGRFQHTALAHMDRWRWSTPIVLGLAHRRLAILDLLPRGRQPMASPDAGVWIVFNGEIYNYRELRAELEAAGIQFITQTDTEVLLHAYLQWGERSLDRIEGMFAFAIWDGVSERLFCARDRLGIKPFYYATPRGRFVFGSEIKALLASPGLEPTPDDEAVVAFLLHSNCDFRERTMFRQIKSLPAAHALTVEASTGTVRVSPYWKLEASADGVRRDGDRRQIEDLKDLLLRTTCQHLISDVRVGSCLSGGLDSSTVVSLIGKIRREKPEAATAIGDRLDTFTSCYDYREFDEREYALSVARAVGATAHLVFPTSADFWTDFQRMAWHQDMPFGGFSFYAQWRVMRAAREAGVKVLIDGQGGDEVFGGYAKFRYAYLASLLRSGRLVTMANECARTLGQADRYVLDLRNGYRYLPGSLRRLLKVDSALEAVLRVDWTHAVSDESTPATRWWRHAASAHDPHSGWSVCQQIQVDDIFIDTLPQLLRMEDRSSMAFSLEARVPFLDHRVVEYGVALPDRLKFRNGWSKFAVREAMRDEMPDGVRLRKTKLGFAAPDREWLFGELRPHITELIHEDLRCHPYVDPAALRRWYCSPDAQDANTESYLGLFRILSLEMWMRAFHG